MSIQMSRRAALALGGGGALGAMVGASAPAAATDWKKLTVVSANIGRDHLDQRRPSIRRVRDCALRPFVGWQEINEGDRGEKVMLNQIFGSAYANAFLQFPRAYRVPISVPAPWKIVRRVATFTHGPLKDVSPPRFINEALVQNERHSGLKFVMMNTHYIAGAYRGPRVPERQPYWDKHKRIHKERILAWHRQGRLVIWTGDVNRDDYGKATGREDEHRVFFNGIDRINWMQGSDGVQLRLAGKRTVDLTVDDLHDARVADFQIRHV